MTDIQELKVLFVAGFGPIVRDRQASAAFYLDTLRLPLNASPGNPEYFHGEALEGVKHFALWPLAQAAEACFGTPAWPAHLPVPQSWLEFDVEDVGAATAVLKARGYSVLVDARLEPWGQTVTRLLGPEGILVGLTLTPSMR